MPYYVFRVSADKKSLSLINAFDRFVEAKDACRALRRGQAPGAADLVRMTFAADEKDARRLLAEPRQPSSPLEEWEA